ncbi:PREDICTED: hypoxia up-regulated protein 1 isoform X1 [Nanorana parkeri]|uniref:hypoxia up-regulated protein 1 isoform X1 n=1 Tax=Nanorana parkeri TaxID=125878 RepID=UPI000854B6C2|nr:PREDICTED: hypoxia up-regulated protein 1 isoform X1 [Nanorana parkeri]XP_018421666.1 PREDICTED: hypoxia up-regulated protein 1 isoform X1 [Nanorana parkeri]
MGLAVRTAGVLFLFLLVDFLPSQTESVAVMSVDLGCEWLKIAIVKPGVPMEIVLNKESRRKTPFAVTLKDDERLFGDSATGMAAKNPKVTFRFFQDLLGKGAENPQVEAFKRNFPQYNIVKDEMRGTALFKLSEEATYSPEEVLAMMLNYSRSLAEEFAEQPIKDAVITVPAFFNQAERRAVLQAAKLGGLKVLQLINDNTAVALNYGVFRRKDINSTAQNIMFYDMGSRSTTCTIVTYQTVKTKDSGIQPQLQIRGVGFDRTLGGLEMDLRLRDRLAKIFNEQKKSKKDVRENPRAMVKLLKEANRVKTILSANNDHMAQIEGLMDDIDFKTKVTRQELEELCGDLFERVSIPVRKALSGAEMNMEEIDQVIIVGGATRVPKVQEHLLKAVGKEELGKNINADEAAAMGAVYQAAALSKAFKVKPFVVRDAAIYPVQVEFTREVEEEGVKSMKHNKRILFQRLAPYPQRKVITFNRYTDDFEFDINYGDLGFLDSEDLKIFASRNLTTVKLSGVGESFQKKSDYESKGIKAHFNMDESGILSLDRVESVFETALEEKSDQESTLTKLGNTISSLFGGGSSSADKENSTDTVQEEEEVPSESTKEEEQDSPEPAEQQDGDTGASKAENKSQDENNGDKETKDSKEKSESPKETGTKNEPEEEPKKPAVPKKQKIVDEIAAVQTVNDIPSIPEEEEKKSIKKLQTLTERDIEKHEHEKAGNSLEAFIFETQDKLKQDEFIKVSTKEQRAEISSKLRQVSGWLEEDGYQASTKELNEKLTELKKACKSLFFKVEERRKWPDRLSALDSLLNHSTIFLKTVRMIPEDEQVFTDVELGTLQKLINETSAWKNETLAEQAKLPKTERPVLLSKDIEQKLGALDREVQYLLNKAKFSKPKPKQKSNTTKSENGENITDTKEKVTTPKTESTEGQANDPEPVKEPPVVEEKILELAGSETDSQTEQPSEEEPKTEL